MKGIKKSNNQPLFNRAFYFVGIITILTLIINVTLSVSINNPTSNVIGAIYTCDFAFKSGFGAILGLIGGKISY